MKGLTRREKIWQYYLALATRPQTGYMESIYVAIHAVDEYDKAMVDDERIHYEEDCK